jgi:hypothetical protein
VSASNFPGRSPQMQNALTNYWNQMLNNSSSTSTSITGTGDYFGRSMLDEFNYIEFRTHDGLELEVGDFIYKAFEKDGEFSYKSYYVHSFLGDVASEFEDIVQGPNIKRVKLLEIESKEELDEEGNLIHPTDAVTHIMFHKEVYEYSSSVLKAFERLYGNWINNQPCLKKLEREIHKREEHIRELHQELIEMIGQYTYTKYERPWVEAQLQKIINNLKDEKAQREWKDRILAEEIKWEDLIK